jgi:hypothetical protein
MGGLPTSRFADRNLQLFADQHQTFCHLQKK